MAFPHALGARGPSALRMSAQGYTLQQDVNARFAWRYKGDRLLMSEESFAPLLSVISTPALSSFGSVRKCAWLTVSILAIPCEGTRTDVLSP